MSKEEKLDSIEHPTNVRIKIRRALKRYWAVFLFLIPIIADSADILTFFGVHPFSQTEPTGLTPLPSPVLIDSYDNNSQPVTRLPKKRASGVDFSIIDVKTLPSVIRTDTFKQVYRVTQILRNDFETIYHDTLVTYKTKYKKFSVQVEIVNYFSKPLVIHNIFVLDTHDLAKLYYSHKIPSAGGKNPDSLDFDLTFKKYIPSLRSIRFYRKGNSSMSQYLRDNEYFHIPPDIPFIADLVFITKDTQSVLVCKVYDWDGCKKIEKVNYPRSFSAVIIDFSMPGNDSMPRKRKSDTVVFYRRARH